MRFTLLVMLGLMTVVILAQPSVGQDERDLKKLAEMKKGAAEGKAWDQSELGVYYSEALHDNKTAVAWFKKSAEQGFAPGACNLAIHYYWGMGVAKNRIMALTWAFISNSLDGLKCGGEIQLFYENLKPTKAEEKRAWARAESFLMSHPELKNNFGKRPWFDQLKDKKASSNPH